MAIEKVTSNCSRMDLDGNENLHKDLFPSPAGKVFLSLIRLSRPPLLTVLSDWLLSLYWSVRQAILHGPSLPSSRQSLKAIAWPFYLPFDLCRFPIPQTPTGGPYSASPNLSIFGSLSNFCTSRGKRKRCWWKRAKNTPFWGVQSLCFITKKVESRGDVISDGQTDPFVGRNKGRPNMLKAFPLFRYLG